MIKSDICNKSKNMENDEYPCLYITDDDDQIMLFLSERTGICVYTAEYEEGVYQLWQYYDNLDSCKNTNIWEKFNGIVKIWN